MRERWARRLALLSCVSIIAVSAVFAATRNIDDPTGPTPALVAPPAATAVVDEAAIEFGREVYASLDCNSCHSIAGQGSPRSPLDGVGSRLDRDEILEWIIGDDAVAEELSPRALRAKRAYRDLETARLDALVGYLASLGG